MSQQSRSEDETSPRVLKTTETSLEVIEFLKRREGARVSEVAAELDTTPSSAYGHLATLEEMGYLVKEGDIYHLSLSFLELGKFVQYRKEVYEQAEAHTERLSEQTDFRVQFTVEENGRAVYLFHKPGENTPWDHMNEGKEQYLHCIAAGKAILSELPESRVDEIIDQHGLPAQTENTITDREELFEELEEIEERGYARNHQETIEGIRAVAAPVTSPYGEVIGALAVGGAVNVLRDEAWNEEIPTLVSGAANELELDIELT